MVSIDSRQLFRGVEIASNAPTPWQRAAARFHLVGVLDPWATVDAALYTRLARAALEDVATRNLPAVLTAGTGLYLRALRRGFGLGGRPRDPGLRAELEAEATTRGLAGLVGRLAELDPAGAAVIDSANSVRVVRALELAILRQAQPLGGAGEASSGPPVPMTVIFLDCDRALLHNRIRVRAENMVESGLAEEFESLMRSPRPPSVAVLRSIGVAEIAAMSHGHMSRAQAVEAIAVRTRNYAKRQLTWFRHEQPSHRLDVTGMGASDIVDAIFEMGLC